MTYPAWLQNILDGKDSPERMAGDFPWASSMIGCPHDTVYHAEGDPWTHTCMVVKELLDADGFEDLTSEAKEILKISAWAHDLAKPMVTQVYWDEDQSRKRVSQPGHARLGADIIWRALTDAGYDSIRARDVYHLVSWHQRPTHLFDQKRPYMYAVRFASEVQNVSWRDLLRLCKADQSGRICLSPDGADDNLELLALYFEEQKDIWGGDLLNTAFPFKNDEARLRFLNKPTPENLLYTPRPAVGSRMILMSGLPGSGKDTAIATHFPDLPVVSLDNLRDEMGIKPEDNQGRVVQAALEAARVHLRAKKDFVWNATNLSRFSRQKIIRLALSYDARIDAVSVEVPADVAKSRNAARKDPLPDFAIERLARKREPICTSEVHGLHLINESLQMEHVFGDSMERLPDETLNSPSL